MKPILPSYLPGIPEDYGLKQLTSVAAPGYAWMLGVTLEGLTKPEDYTFEFKVYDATYPDVVTYTGGLDEGIFHVRDEDYLLKIPKDVTATMDYGSYRYAVTVTTKPWNKSEPIVVKQGIVEIEQL